MRSSISLSVALHMVVVLVSAVGLPYIQRSPAKEQLPLVVELVSIAPETHLPSRVEAEPDPPKKVKNPPPPTRTEPKPPIVTYQPKPNQIMKKPSKKKLGLLPKRSPKPVASKKLVKVNPRRKPRPPDPFETILKNLTKKLKKKRVEEKQIKKKKEHKTNFEQKISKLLTQRRISETDSNHLTMTERHAMMNTVRTAIRPCWNLQPGAKGAQDIVVVVRATLTPDGRVTRAWVANRSVLVNDPFKLAAAETAQRAILNRACQPFKLDPRKYDVWRDITLNFNPSEMFGK